MFFYLLSELKYFFKFVTLITVITYSSQNIGGDL